MSKQHTYRATVEWTGNLGSGTSSYTAYSRDYTVQIAGKPDLLGSSDPAFRGDEHRHNPEDMLLAAISACHKLWYLHLCSAAGITVTAYADHAEAVMDEGDNARPGKFVKATLRPQVTITPGAARRTGQSPAPRSAQPVLYRQFVEFRSGM